MRASTSAAALAFSSVVAAHGAAADDGAEGISIDRAHGWDHATQSGLDAGVVWTRFDNTTMPGGWNLTGEAMRFGAYAAPRGHLYLRAELDVGWLHGNGPAAGVQDYAVARTADGMAPSSGTTTGRLVAAKAVVGLRTLRGPITAAVEVAGGVRTTLIGDTRFGSWTSSQTDPLLEARGRLDLWVTRGLSLAVVAGINALAPDNLTAGVLIGAHLPR